MPHELRLSPADHSPRDARLFVSHWAKAWGYRSLVQPAALLTSELVNNAVVHTGDRFTVSVANTGRGVEVSVEDCSPQPPVLREPKEVDLRGRGLLLVDGLATDWGAELFDGPGKRVWFRLDLGEPSLLQG